jgi:hypothetical protein
MYRALPRGRGTWFVVAGAAGILVLSKFAIVAKGCTKPCLA